MDQDKNIIFSYETRGKSHSLATHKKKKVSDKTVRVRSRETIQPAGVRTPQGIVEVFPAPLPAFSQMKRSYLSKSYRELGISKVLRSPPPSPSPRVSKRHARYTHTQRPYTRASHTHARNATEISFGKVKMAENCTIVALASARAILRAPFALTARSHAWRKLAKYVNCLIT